MPEKSAIAQPSSLKAHGLGLATRRVRGGILDTWFPDPRLGDVDPSKDPWLELLNYQDDARPNTLLGTEVDLVQVEIELNKAPRSVEDAYLRLHLLSHRLVTPNSINLDGIFSILPSVVFTSHGPIHPDDFHQRRMTLQRAGVSTHGLDKFPRMVDYVVPSGVRIADANRVRLGAYLAEGTTVMHEGFINFNAGTLGPSMIEGRISQGVVVGAGSDIGGGASIMGTLSGGGRERIRIGERSLLGANSGIGISLGDDCVVEAGLYITAGSRVTVVHPADGSNMANRVQKAVELSGISGMLFRRNSQSGVIEAISRQGVGVHLNQTLHA